MGHTPYRPGIKPAAPPRPPAPKFQAPPKPEPPPVFRMPSGRVYQRPLEPQIRIVPAPTLKVDWLDMAMIAVIVLLCLLTVGYGVMLATQPKPPSAAEPLERRCHVHSSR